jgi:hypothetical protein
MLNMKALFGSKHGGAYYPGCVAIVGIFRKTCATPLRGPVMDMTRWISTQLAQPLCVAEGDAILGVPRGGWWPLRGICSGLGANNNNSAINNKSEQQKSAALRYLLDRAAAT